MSQANIGHVGNSGVQIHSAGNYFPLRLEIVENYDNFKHEIRVVDGSNILRVFRYSNCPQFRQEHTRAEQFAVDHVSGKHVSPIVEKHKYRYLANCALRSIEQSGGFSTNEVGLKPSFGFLVSTSEHELKLSQWSIDDVQLYFASHPLKQNQFWGGWIDNGTLYLDVSIAFASREDAIEFGNIHNQLAIYDCTSGNCESLLDAITASHVKEHTANNWDSYLNSKV